MKYSKQQIYTTVAAVLFLIGAIFMLIDTFATSVDWALWVGLGFAAAASTVFILLAIENRKSISKQLRDTSPPANKNTKNEA